MQSSSAPQDSPPRSQSGPTASSSSSEENNFPEPIIASKLSPYQVGDKVVIIPSSLQTDKIKINNLLFANIEPPPQAKGWNRMMNFIWFHPMAKILLDKPSWVFQDLLCEFWTSCKIGVTNDGDQAITGSILNKSKNVNITLSKLKRAFDLEYRTDGNYVNVVSHAQAKSILSDIGYTGDMSGVVKMKHLTGIWNFLLSTLSKSLQVKAGSFDQPNALEMQIFHSIVTVREVDYAALIFNDLISRINNKGTTIPYGRILAILIELRLKNDFRLATGQTVEVKAIANSIFNPKKVKQDLLPAMNAFLENRLKKEQDEAQSDSRTISEQRDVEQHQPEQEAQAESNQAVSTQAQLEPQIVAGTQISSPPSSPVPASTSVQLQDSEELVTTSTTPTAPSISNQKVQSDVLTIDIPLSPSVSKKKRTTITKSVSASTLNKLKIPTPASKGTGEADELSEADPVPKSDITKGTHPHPTHIQKESEFEHNFKAVNFFVRKSAHPSSRDVLMDVDSGRVDQYNDQQIPTTTQVEQTITPQAFDGIIISRSTHETHSHEEKHLDILSSYLPNYFETDNRDFRMFFPENMVESQSASTSQAATVSVKDVVNQLNELKSTVTVESLKLSKSLDNALKAKELTDDPLDLLKQTQDEQLAKINKTLEVFQQTQTKLTSSFEKAMEDMAKRHQEVLDEMQKRHESFTNKVAQELQHFTKETEYFKNEMLRVSRQMGSKLSALSDEKKAEKNTADEEKARAERIKKEAELRATEIDKIKKAQAEREAAIRAGRWDLVIFGSPSEREKNENDEFVEGEKSQKNMGIDTGDTRVEIAMKAEPLQSVPFTSNSSQSETTLSIEWKKKNDESVEGEKSEMNMGSDAGDIRVEEAIKDVPVESAPMKNESTEIEQKPFTSKSSQSEQTQSVAVQGSSQPDPDHEIPINYSSEDNRTDQYKVEKRFDQLTEEEQEKEQAKFEAVLKGITLEACLSLRKAEREAELAKKVAVDDEKLRKMLAEEEAQTNKGKGKGKRVAVGKPNAEIKKVVPGTEFKSQLDKMDKRLMSEKIHFRRYNETIINCVLKRKRYQSLPSIRVVRQGYETSSENVDLDKLNELGYTEWVELHNVISTQSGIHKDLVIGEIERRFRKIKYLKVDISGSPTPEFYNMIDNEEEEQEEEDRPFKRKKKLTAPEGTHADFLKNLSPVDLLSQLSAQANMKTLKNLNLTLPNVPNATAGLFIESPEHGIFFINAYNHLSFQRTAELEIAPHIHLYTLYKFCMAFKDLSRGYESYVINEGDKRKLDVTESPTFEVKQEAVDLIEES